MKKEYTPRLTTRLMLLVRDLEGLVGVWTCLLKDHRAELLATSEISNITESNKKN